MKKEFNVKEQFEKDIEEFSNIYVDVRDSSGFAFYFEGVIKDVYEKEGKLYFNQNYLSMEYGFFSLKVPWEKLHYKNNIYSLVHEGFRVSILMIPEEEN